MHASTFPELDMDPMMSPESIGEGFMRGEP
jgi:hypothetical protein